MNLWFWLLFKKPWSVLLDKITLLCTTFQLIIILATSCYFNTVPTSNVHFAQNKQRCNHTYVKATFQAEFSCHTVTSWFSPPSSPHSSCSGRGPVTCRPPDPGTSCCRPPSSALAPTRSATPGFFFFADLDTESEIHKQIILVKQELDT